MCTHRCVPLPCCLHTSHSSFRPVSLTTRSQLRFASSACSTIHVSASACSYVPTVLYPMSSDRYLAKPRIRASDIWGRFVFEFILTRQSVTHLVSRKRFYKSVSAFGRAKASSQCMCIFGEPVGTVVLLKRDQRCNEQYGAQSKQRATETPLWGQEAHGGRVQEAADRGTTGPRNLAGTREKRLNRDTRIRTHVSSHDHLTRILAVIVKLQDQSLLEWY
jgi:hypothetical protein